MADDEPREVALANVRDAVAALHKVPATALDAEKHDAITGAEADLVAVEQQLHNECEQARGSGDDEPVLYLTTARCPECEQTAQFAHRDDDVALDMEPPWPYIAKKCPGCGSPYPDDFGSVVEEVTEARPVDPMARVDSGARGEADD